VECREFDEYDGKTKTSFSLAPLGERGDRKTVGEGVGSIPEQSLEWTEQSDPLTRPAPSDESAGGGPPSPPRGRGTKCDWFQYHDA
jgi:hypothetical protein